MADTDDELTVDTPHDKMGKPIPKTLFQKNAEQFVKAFNPQKQPAKSAQAEEPENPEGPDAFNPEVAKFNAKMDKAAADTRAQVFKDGGSRIPMSAVPAHPGHPGDGGDTGSGY